MIKIFAVDDSDQFLDSLASFFAPFPKQYSVVGLFSALQDEDGIQEMLDTFMMAKPDIVLMDFSFDLIQRPVDFGIVLIKRILEKRPAQKIIMLVGDQFDEDDQLMTPLKRSFQAAAVAYLRKDEPHTWMESIRETVLEHSPKHLIPDTIIPVFVESLKKGRDLHLTMRETEAIHYLSADKKVKEVADLMEIGFDGATFHLENAKVKLGVKTLQGLIAQAFRFGIVS